MRRPGGTRIFGDIELRVLWLTHRGQELALSGEGVWVRSGRRQTELVWAEIAQLQTGRGIVAPKGTVRVEVFTTDGRAITAGPFGADEAGRWLGAAADAAGEAGVTTRPLDGSAGFALRTGSQAAPAAS